MVQRYIGHFLTRNVYATSVMACQKSVIKFSEQLLTKGGNNTLKTFELKNLAEVTAPAHEPEVVPQGIRVD